MKRRLKACMLPGLLVLGIACAPPTKKEGGGQVSNQGSYAFDAEFLRKHTRRFVELSDKEGQAKIALSADYQGRVMTSTADGDAGISFGWINYSLIESGKSNPQFNPVGGEERLWLGPEGGQFSLYFAGGSSFEIANWRVPAIIDTVPFDIRSSTDTSAVFGKTASLKNFSGTAFQIEIERTVQLLGKAAIATELKAAIPKAVKAVGYKTLNRLTNAGLEKWTKEGGLLSIWLLGMFTPSSETTVIIPFKNIDDARSYITDDYFGDMPNERLMVRDSLLYFSADGKYRSKIGLAPELAKPLAASFDFKNNILTLIKFNVEPDGLYVNSKWELQKQPYKGDVVNSYNDGPLADGTQLGPFYELESSSPARELEPGETQEYSQTTCHFTGSYEDLAKLAAALGINLNEAKLL